MDLPGYGTMPGEWNLRAGVREYLGGVGLRGKRVLEVGTASGTRPPPGRSDGPYRWC
jgi:hypothetical protein